MFEAALANDEADGQAHALNAEQMRAVEHTGGPLMVLSGPGTGKTRVITHRIAHLIQQRGVRPESILALTYTVKAAAQMRDRLAALVGHKAQGVKAYTIHGFGYRLIRRFGSAGKGGMRGGNVGAGDRDAEANILDSAQRTRTLRRIIKDHGIFAGQMVDGVESLVVRTSAVMDAMHDAAVTVEAARAFIARARAAIDRGCDALGRELDRAGADAETARVAMLEQAVIAIEHFDRYCRERGWMSFGDMVSLPIRILDTHATAAAIVRGEVRHVVVDEFQDVNVAQIELLRRLCPPADAPDLCVVGDDDQSIYEFRGADDQAFARFGSIWTGHATVRLEENYRSRPEIITVANTIMARAERRFDAEKTIVAGGTHSGPAVPVECVQAASDDQYPELIAAMILMDRTRHPGKKWSSYAVIGRRHADLDRVAATLAIEGVPAIAMRAPSVLDDAGVQDVLAWVELLVNPRNVHAAIRLLTRPPISAPIRDILPLQERYAAAAARHEQQVEGAADPGGFAEWLEANAPDAPGVRSFVEHVRVLSEESAQLPASEAIVRIITRTDPAHADFAEARQRAERVRSLVALVRFARERQPRLDAPGDLRAFWSYFNDLDDGERTLRDANVADRVDGPASDDPEPPDAVRLITAHSAKGLEFDTVFVPRISPVAGYGRPSDGRDVDVPAGLLRGADDRTDRERGFAEERRVFYVACTRAEQRLVLIAKKNKNRSTSTHLFEEIVHDPTLTDVRAVLSGDDVLAEAGKQGVWRVGTRTPLDAERAMMRAAPARREVFEAARRDLRLSAASALDTAGGGEMEPAASVRMLGDAVRAFAAIDHAERTGVPPEWAVRAGGWVLDHVRGVLARANAVDGGVAAAGVSAVNIVAPPPKPPLVLSYSHIDAYLRCPRCYCVRHVLKLKSPGSDALMVGTTAHAALEEFYRELRDAEAEGRDVPGLTRLLEIARSEFYAAIPDRVAPDAMQLRQLLAQLEQAYERLHDPRASVLELERWVSFPYGPHTINAKIDRIDQVTLADGSMGSLIIDYKTGQAVEKLRAPKPDDLQLGIYAMALAHDQGLAFGEVPKGRAEYWLLATGERGSIDFADLRLDKIRATIDKAIAGILAGDWTRGKGGRDDAHECDILGPE